MSKHDDKEKLLQKFDELISSSRLHLNLAEGTTIDDISDEDKITIDNIDDIYKYENDLLNVLKRYL
jgi:hypothetical protein